MNQTSKDFDNPCAFFLCSLHFVLTIFLLALLSRCVHEIGDIGEGHLILLGDATIPLGIVSHEAPSQLIKDDLSFGIHHQLTATGVSGLLVLQLDPICFLRDLPRITESNTTVNNVVGLQVS
jgi:hypothetical protein